MSGNAKGLLAGLFKTLVPSKTSKVEVTLEQIDKTPLPTFPSEVKTTPSVPLGSGAAKPPGSGGTSTQNVDVSLSDPKLQISDRFGESSEDTEYIESVGVLKTNAVKAVKEAALIPRSTPFEIFNRKHLNACQGLIEVLYYIDDENLNTLITYASSLVNEELLNYCINVVARHRPDFIEQGIQFPSHITTHPSTYVDVSKVETIVLTRQINGQEITEPVEIESVHDFTATDAEPEHFIAYFREDVGVNLHHRHWHEVYPNIGPKPVVDLDRRGELFVYMHAQILARYNFERLCNELMPVKKFSKFDEPIREAYYPKLDEASEVKVWSPRQPNAVVKDITRDGQNCEIADLERWTERIISSIDRGYAIQRMENGEEVKVKLVEPTAINNLGNTIEAVPALSYNYPYYGDLHTNGHIVIAYCHDPDKRFKEVSSVMGRLEAALRDPIFYRWHAFIDDIIDRYRLNLQPYKLLDRKFDKIEIENVEIDSDIAEKNVIQTFWQKDRVDVTNGILSLREIKLKKQPAKVYVKFTHLQHKDFTYKFRVYNWRTKPTTGVVRVFMAPLHDETRREMPFNKLRRFMIELDKFTVQLRKGKNEFTRSSKCSSVTVPFEQTFMTPDQALEFTANKKKAEDVWSYCGCGWPHHMLIGKGRAIGMQCTLFVMITDYDEDKIEGSTIESCGNTSISYCGVRNKKYPDKRPMGFPFDRPLPDSEANLATFMTESQKTHDKEPMKVRNMYQTIFKVKFIEETQLGPTCDLKNQTC